MTERKLIYQYMTLACRTWRAGRGVCCQITAGSTPVGLLTDEGKTEGEER